MHIDYAVDYGAFLTGFMTFSHEYSAVLPLTINGQGIENVQCFKFLGTTISATLKWDINLRDVIKKNTINPFFSRQRKKCGVYLKSVPW